MQRGPDPGRVGLPAAEQQPVRSGQVPASRHPQAGSGQPNQVGLGPADPARLESSFQFRQQRQNRAAPRRPNRTRASPTPCSPTQTASSAPAFELRYRSRPPAGAVPPAGRARPARVRVPARRRRGLAGSCRRPLSGGVWPCPAWTKPTISRIAPAIRSRTPTPVQPEPRRGPAERVAQARRDDQRQSGRVEHRQLIVAGRIGVELQDVEVLRPLRVMVKLLPVVDRATGVPLGPVSSASFGWIAGVPDRRRRGVAVGGVLHDQVGAAPGS